MPTLQVASTRYQKGVYPVSLLSSIKFRKQNPEEAQRKWRFSEVIQAIFGPKTGDVQGVFLILNVGTGLK